MESVVFNQCCMEGMKQFPDKWFDVCITDAPYGNDTDYASYNDSVKNTTEFISVFMPEIIRISKRVVITTGVKLMYYYPKPDWVASIYFPSGIGRGSHGFCCWQPILIYGKDPYAGMGSMPDSFQWVGVADKEASFHPCPKPIKMWKKVFNRWVGQSDKTIIDPFTGSGTSRIVADLIGLDFTGFEIDKDYFEAQEKRFKQYKSQLVMNL